MIRFYSQNEVLEIRAFKKPGASAKYLQCGNHDRFLKMKRYFLKAIGKITNLREKKLTIKTRGVSF